MCILIAYSEAHSRVGEMKRREDDVKFITHDMFFLARCAGAIFGKGDSIRYDVVSQFAAINIASFVICRFIGVQVCINLQ